MEGAPSFVFWIDWDRALRWNLEARKRGAPGAYLAYWTDRMLPPEVLPITRRPRVQRSDETDDTYLFVEVQQRSGSVGSICLKRTDKEAIDQNNWQNPGPVLPSKRKE